jgi:hypothetical protein
MSLRLHNLMLLNKTANFYKDYVKLGHRAAEENRVQNSIISYLTLGSRDSAVGVATGYGLDDRGVGIRVPVGARSFCSPCRPDRFCVPPNLLSNGYRGLFPRERNRRGVKLTTHLHLQPSSRKVEIYLYSPIRLHGKVLN